MDNISYPSKHSIMNLFCMEFSQEIWAHFDMQFDRKVVFELFGFKKLEYYFFTAIHSAPFKLK